MDLTDTPDVRDVGEDPPDFTAWKDPEELLKDQSTRERMLDVVLQLRDPMKVSEIADRVECDTETARDYLEWFSAMGIAREHVGRPVRYNRNESYLRWRRVEQIRASYSEEEIVEELESAVEQLDAYRERFDAESPDGVSLMDASREVTVTEAWEALSEWKTLRRRAALLDAARRGGTVAGSDVGLMDA